MGFIERTDHKLGKLDKLGARQLERDKQRASQCSWPEPEGLPADDGTRRTKATAARGIISS